MYYFGKLNICVLVCLWLLILLCWFSVGTRQYKYTYISDQTMDPLWFGQKFIFDVPEKASTASNRGYSIRVVVKSVSISGKKFMGQTEVPLSGLRSENEVSGWFPLRGKAFQSITATRQVDVSLENYGSIKLRLQWVYSDHGLVRHIQQELRRFEKYFVLVHFVVFIIIMH
jgi:hypothetical protein